MAYTHTFELDVNGSDLQGELKFDSGVDAAIKFDAAPEMPVVELKQFTMFIEQIVNICSQCGDIQKIEINKKAI
jgi:hypothetical protein